MSGFEGITGRLTWLVASLAVALTAGCAGGGGGGNDAVSVVPVASVDSLSPTVSGTTTANGATNVAINVKVGATFSETMDPSTITTATFFLMQGTTVVPGAVSYSGVSAVLIPAGNLAPASPYTVTVKGGVGGAKNLAGNWLASDYVWAWTTGAIPDTIPPKVTRTINANGATGVAVNTKVGVTFSEAMDPSTITAATLFLAQGTTVVPGAVSYSGVSAAFIPSSNLAPGTRYTVMVKGGVGGVRDLAGNPLASDYAWAWTTGTTPDIIPPTVSEVIHANGATDVAINSKVGATFSEAMDPLTINTKTFFLMQGMTAVPGTVSYSGVSAVFIPSGNLAPTTRYTVTVKGGVGGVKDLAGNSLASDYAWTWTTGTTSDTISPTVSGTSIADGATNVGYNSLVGATFSKVMDPLTITNVNCTLVDTTSGTPAGQWTVNYSGVSVEFHPDMYDFGPLPPSILRPGTGYTVTIKGGVDGVVDLAGNPMVNDRVWSFTTSAATQ